MSGRENSKEIRVKDVRSEKIRSVKIVPVLEIWDGLEQGGW